MQTEVTNQIQEHPPVQPAQPIAWPKDAKDVRDFFHADFITAQFAAADQTPCDEDRYLIRAHDFLSAVNWWANFPHVSRPPQTAPLPLLMRDIARDHGITALEACQALKDLGNFSVNTAVTAEMAAKLRELFPVPQAAPAAVAVQLDANGIAPCPLCGSESKHVKADVGGHRILCWNDDCECSSGYFCSKEEAITSWNNRAALAATPAADATAQTIERQRMTAGRASFFMERFLREEKLLGPNEQAALHFVIDILEAAAAPVVLPEPVGWRHSRTLTLHETEQEVQLADGDSHAEPLFTEEQLRALLAQAATAAAPAHPAEGVQTVERGEVLVTVSGFTGCGKSAVAGEIEILCRALGLQVEWPDGESEKNMTHADWTEALELYKPRVRIVEQNIPFASKKGLSK